MSIRINNIEKFSPADKAGIQPGDFLISMNGHDIIDVLDFRFYQVNSKIDILLKKVDGTERNFNIRKGEYEELGIIFDTYLMDKEKNCKNKCIFCFIDQLPKGMRKSLYFKDDDSRLSFLFGNYITLTNLSDHEIDRIISMHISPINVSVHTTNKDLRIRMMRNPKAGNSLGILNRLVENGIKINCQLVMCRGINDGKELENTLNDLKNLGDSVECISVVPVGITKFRDDLYPLQSYDQESSKEIIDIVTKFQQRFFNKYGRKVVFAADEFYLKAKEPLPTAEFYEDFDQLENGVGMLSLMKQEFKDALNEVGNIDIKKDITLACGVAAYDTFCELSNELHNKFPNINLRVVKVVNDFFGHEITVSGLITGTDLIKTLKKEGVDKDLFITSSMLNHDGTMFLDNMTIEDIEKELNTKITAIDNDGYLIMDHIMTKK